MLEYPKYQGPWGWQQDPQLGYQGDAWRSLSRVLTRVSTSLTSRSRNTDTFGSELVSLSEMDLISTGFLETSHAKPLCPTWILQRKELKSKYEFRIFCRREDLEGLIHDHPPAPLSSTPLHGLHTRDLPAPSMRNDGEKTGKQLHFYFLFTFSTAHRRQ